jgi:hypothetical protein
LRVTATDLELSSHDDITVTVFPPAEPPEIQIISPDDSQSITAPTAVMGSVNSSILASYELQIRRIEEDSPWTILNTGTAPVSDGILGTLDPTLALNGFYEFRVVATDQVGRLPLRKHADHFRSPPENGRFLHFFQ